MGSDSRAALFARLRKLKPPPRRKRKVSVARTRERVNLWETRESQSIEHERTAFEVSPASLVRRAYGCPTPNLLVAPSAPAGERLRAIPCGRWTCDACGPKRCAEFTRRVLVGIEGYLDERHARAESAEEVPHELTLTFRPDDLPGERKSPEQLRAARRSWDRWVRAVNEGRRRQGLPRLVFVKVWEYTEVGVPHMHCIVIGNPWPVSVPHRTRSSCSLTKRQQQTRGKVFLTQFGFGFVHTWDPVRDARAFGRYLAEYVTKAAGMHLPKHCPRYSASRDFMPGLKDWRSVRSRWPGLLDVAGARSVLAAYMVLPSGGHVGVRPEGRYWRGPEFKQFAEACREWNRRSRCPDEEQGVGRLRWVGSLQRGGAGGIPMPEPA